MTPLENLKSIVGKEYETEDWICYNLGRSKRQYNDN